MDETTRRVILTLFNEELTHFLMRNFPTLDWKNHSLQPGWWLEHPETSKMGLYLSTFFQQAIFDGELDLFWSSPPGGLGVGPEKRAELKENSRRIEEWIAANAPRISEWAFWNVPSIGSQTHLDDNITEVALHFVIEQVHKNEKPEYLDESYLDGLKSYVQQKLERTSAFKNETFKNEADFFNGFHVGEVRILGRLHQYIDVNIFKHSRYALVKKYVSEYEEIVKLEKLEKLKSPKISRRASESSLSSLDSSFSARSSSPRSDSSGRPLSIYSDDGSIDSVFLGSESDSKPILYRSDSKSSVASHGSGVSLKSDSSTGSHGKKARILHWFSGILGKKTPQKDHVASSHKKKPSSSST